jgi:hypothetical protein
MSKKLITILIIFGLLLPSFCFGEIPGIVEVPKTIDEVKEIVHEAIGAAEKELPGILERIWRDEVLPVWRSIWRWSSGVWNRHIGPRVQRIWQRIQELFGREVEKRRPIIKEEFEKEKQEIKKEAPEIGRSIWERFRELISQ